MADENNNNQQENQVENQNNQHEENNNENGGANEKNNSGGEKTFTQAQVDEMLTKGKADALKELGINPEDPKTVALIKAVMESQNNDKASNKGSDNEAQAKLNEAERRAQVAEAKAEAMILGAKRQYVDDVVALALTKMSSDTDLKTIIGEFKTKYPTWFEEADEDEDDKNGKKSDGTGTSVKKFDKTGKKGDDKGNKSWGSRLAAQRKGNGTKKSSYWS